MTDRHWLMLGRAAVVVGLLPSAVALAAVADSVHPVLSVATPDRSQPLEGPLASGCPHREGALATETLGITEEERQAIPLTHTIVLMQENRSFDHYLGHLSEAGQPAAEALPRQAANPDRRGRVVRPFHLPTTCWPHDPPHQWNAMHAHWNQGRMDGFVVSAGDEFRPGCSGTCPPSASGYANLTTTEIDRPSQVFLVSTGNPLPEATLVGPGGRLPPATVIDDDGVTDVESGAATFSPESDGIDFYESLEAMRVEVRDAVVVGPTNDFNEIPVLAGGGSGAGLRSARGGIVVAAGDFNPERIFLDGSAMPATNVGDVFAGSTFAVVDYTFGN